MYNFGKEISILTETLPTEIPLIYSNHKLYEYIKSNKEDFLKCDLHNKKDAIFTVPFTYMVRKNENEYRRLSLLHPIGQVQIANMLSKYDNLLLSYFNNNNIFSIRRPASINDKYLKIENKYKLELAWIEEDKNKYLEDEENELVNNYFVIKSFKTITELYKSDYIKNLELKYSSLIRIDYANCFESIYTHSLEWAYVGDKNIIKNNLNDKRFSAILDILAQRINYNETNGLVVGPEISRILAEIVLTRIDKNVYFDLKNENIIYKKDYEIIRFIDDIMIFYNDENIGERIKYIIEDNSREFKLKINTAKTKNEQRPFFREHMWISHCKKSIKYFLKYYENEVSYNKYPYDRFIEEFKELICIYDTNRRYIISYVLSAVEDKIIYILDRIKDLQDLSLIKYHYTQLVDMVIYIINYYKSFDNSIKLCRIIYKIKKASKILNIDLEDFIFKKLSMFLYYNENDIASLLNIIILISDNSNFVSEKYLLDIIKKHNDYFTISVITYYILKKDTSYYSYENIKIEINNILNNVLDDIEFNYGNIKNYGKIIEVVRSDKFYIIHDLYSSGILNNDIKKRIERIRESINSRYIELDKMGMEKLFLGFIKDLDNSFMDWGRTEEDIVRDLIIRKSRNKKIYF